MGCELIGGICELELAEQAAWAQAVFSLVGIGAAILAPLMVDSRRRRRETKREVQKARGYALLVTGEVQDLFALVTQILFSIDRSTPDKDILEGLKDHLKVPESLKLLAPQLHEIGVAGLHIQDAIMLVSRANSEVRAEIIRLLYASTEVGPGLLSSSSPMPYAETLRKAKEKLDSALTEMNQLFPNLRNGD